MEHSGFPSDETLAAFIDGRLDQATRRRVLEHMSSCDECYAVFLAATEMQQAHGTAAPPRRRGPRRRTVFGVVAAAAIVLVVCLTPLRHALQHRRDPGMESLVKATGDLKYRNVEARLSGGFAWKPLQPVMRARVADPLRDPTKWKLLSAAAQVNARAQSNDTAQNLHDLGVSHLLLGNWDDAIATLERARQKDPRDPTIENDLAAAYLARATFRDTAADNVAAVEAAQRAWSLAHTPETAWTRAVTLQRMNLNDDARGAWDDYFALDKRSRWRAEATALRQRLSAKPDSELWHAAEPHATDAALIPDLAEHYPQQLAHFVLETLLPRWAETNDGATLAAIEQIGDALARRSGNGLVAAIAAGARKDRTPATRLAVRELAHAKALFDDQRLRDAEAAYGRARGLAERPCPPLARIAELQMAVCSYSRGDRATAEKWLDTAQTQIAAMRWPAMGPLSLAAQIDSVRGLLELDSAHPHDALHSYEAALTAARSWSDRDTEAAVDALLAQTYEYLGETAPAWRCRRDALGVAMQSGRAPRIRYVLIESAVAAIAERHTEIADVLTRRLLTMSKPNEFATDVHVIRARLLSDTGDLQRARVAAAAIRDTDARKHAQAIVETAEGELLVNKEPQRAIAPLTRALEYSDNGGHHFLRARLFAARGRAWQATGQLAPAIADRNRAIAEVESQRDDMRDPQDRASFIAFARQLYVGSAELAAGTGDAAGALDLAERWRALTTGATPLRAGELSRRLPAGVLVIEFLSLPHRTIAWSIARGGLSMRLLDTNTESISADAERMLAARGDAHAFDESAAALHAQLIAPLHLGRATHIVFVPDPAWPRFPFAALRRAGGPPLLEQVETSTASSASRLVAALAAAPRGSVMQRVLVCADPRVSGAPRLGAARDEALAIRRDVPTAEVIVGRSATRDEFLSRAPAATLIHFGGHALHDERNADFSALLFSDSSTGSGALYAWEIRKLDLKRTRLVVLAACGTAAASHARAGTESISDAFLAAGAPAAIATLWDIGDAPGRELMTALYRRLRDGDSPSHALRLAQIAALHAPGSVPADWAGFELVGL
jgi:CHAT domain-containing protein